MRNGSHRLGTRVAALRAVPAVPLVAEMAAPVALPATDKERQLAAAFMGVAKSLAAVAKILDPQASGAAAMAAPKAKKMPLLGKDGLPKAKRAPTAFNQFMALQIPKIRKEVH